MESPLALYRRYRPETFAEVIGQEHVTEPLRAALAGNRVNHAYLFSGPRGCGKTTSARILARTLNCVQAPVADPCGECDSCVDLARRRPGVDRRHRDRRGVPRWRRRRARPAGEGLLRAGQEPLQGLHHRRGPHGLDAGFQRAAQAGRGAAGAPPLHLRHDRAREGHPDHPLPHPPLPVPADPAAADVLLPLRAVREGRCRGRARGAAARRTRGRRVGPRHPVRPRPADRRRRSRRGHPRAGRRGCWATRPTRCSTRWWTRSPRPTARPCSGSSTRSSRPARTRATSPRTCSGGCATW